MGCRVHDDQLLQLQAVARVVAPTALVRESARSRLLMNDSYDAVDWNVMVTDNGRNVACKAGRE